MKGCITIAVTNVQTARHYQLLYYMQGLSIVPVMTPTGRYYQGSITQKGVSVTRLERTRKKALVVTLQDYLHYLHK